ncbi:hypothetical protein PXH59_09635 [Xenorhabdus sp. SF857]|uniref:hypothetical protein n=1 Tax=Xenorhabdus bakwenae TaxID=3026967 RepID=UPI0025583317|nr:hypothetical protein [Xenorhabdus sp. SF857]WFQ81277.1 hypothetical protein PXH59_09635 [Xenorhabdus sp. SF857]
MYPIDFREVYTEQVDITPWAMVKPTGCLITLIVVFRCVFLAENMAAHVMALYYVLAK